MRAISIRTGIALLMGATSAQADEPAGADWTRHYLGLTLNGRWQTAADAAAPNAVTVIAGKTNWGTQIGGQLGFDTELGGWSVFGQSGRWVIGAEADFGVGSQSVPLFIGAAPQIAICRLPRLQGVAIQPPFVCEPLPIQTAARKLDTLGMA